MKRPHPSPIDDARLKALLKGLRQDVAAPPDFRSKVLERLRSDGLLREVSGSQVPDRRSRAEWFAFLRPAPRWGLALGAALALAWALLPRPVRVSDFPQTPQGAPPVSASPGRGAAGTAVGVGPDAAQPPASNPAGGAFRVADASRPQGSAPRIGTPPRSGSGASTREGLLAAAGGSGPGMPGAPALAPAASGLGPRVTVASSLSTPQGAPAVGAASQAATQSGSLSSGQGPAAAYGSAGSAAASAQGPVSAADSGGSKPTEVVATPTALAQPLRHNSEVRNNVVRVSEGGSAQILFQVFQGGPVLVQIYDRMGRSVALLENGSLSPGQYDLSWNGAADAGGLAASGIYLVVIQTTTYRETHKMALVK
jgi:hypothetical protein